MTLEVKICGISDPDTAGLVSREGASYGGLVFYPPSPRAVTPGEAAGVAQGFAPGVKKVGLFVDPEDALLRAAFEAVALDMIQLHGAEPVARVAEIRAQFGAPVMKVLKIARPEDLEAVGDYAPVTDLFLFDARPPKDRKDALPGGNALSFDWRILAGRRFPRPWMLAGGLTAENLETAVEISGARAVDVSSGVESAPGVKDPQKIKDFMSKARGL
jgi:phosphoribosylanthranilate isomerase